MTVHLIATQPDRYNVDPAVVDLTADVKTWHVDGRQMRSDGAGTGDTVFTMAFPCNNRRSRFSLGISGPTDLHNMGGRLVQQTDAYLFPLASVIQSADYGDLGKPGQIIELHDGDVIVDVEGEYVLKVVAPSGPQASYREPALIVLDGPAPQMDRSAHVLEVEAIRAAR